MPVEGMNCPVCLGVPMLKVRPSQEDDLMLDYCRRCGGMWFNRGEVDQLSKCHPKALNTTIVLTEEAHRMSCHSCQAVMVRSDDTCPACGWLNRLSCPGCAMELKPTDGDQVKLDVCSRCQGIWFDNTELAQIWNSAVESFTAGEAQKSEPRDRFFLDSVLDIYFLDAVIPTGASNWEISGAVRIVGDIIGSLPEAAGSIVEGAGGLAGTIFDALPGVSGHIIEGTGELAKGVFEGLGAVIEGIDF